MQIHESTFILGQPELKALAAYMSREDRPNLAALHFDLKNRRVFATDGHTLLCVTADGGSYSAKGDTVASLPAAAVLAAVKAARKRHTVAVSLSETTAEIKIYATQAAGHIDPPALSELRPEFSATHPLSEHPAPPVEQVIPSYTEQPATPAGCIGFNPRYLARLADLASVGADKTIAVCWYQGGALDPIMVVYEVDGGTVFRAIIMPMRVEARVGGLRGGLHTWSDGGTVAKAN